MDKQTKRTPKVTKVQVNFRASELTMLQLNALAQKWGMTQTETIAIAIDRIHRQEFPETR